MSHLQEQVQIISTASQDTVEPAASLKRWPARNETISSAHVDSSRQEADDAAYDTVPQLAEPSFSHHEGQTVHLPQLSYSSAMPQYKPQRPITISPILWPASIWTPRLEDLTMMEELLDRLARHVERRNALLHAVLNANSMGVARSTQWANDASLVSHETPQIRSIEALTARGRRNEAQTTRDSGDHAVVLNTSASTSCRRDCWLYEESLNQLRNPATLWHILTPSDVSTTADLPRTPCELEALSIGTQSATMAYDHDTRISHSVAAHEHPDISSAPVADQIHQSQDADIRITAMPELATLDCLNELLMLEDQQTRKKPHTEDQLSSVTSQTLSIAAPSQCEVGLGSLLDRGVIVCDFPKLKSVRSTTDAACQTGSNSCSAPASASSHITIRDPMPDQIAASSGSQEDELSDVNRLGQIAQSVWQWVSDESTTGPEMHHTDNADEHCSNFDDWWTWSPMLTATEVETSDETTASTEGWCTDMSWNDDLQ